eukprot:CAMPEP_0174359002 /NCGR_PEP_ID=MMETSP0811_2-20130205/45852_1 /TAXON_ID=73025 ORGANISM="Eutreptiella gymnastica-like, Strain CCMP1594" /NCGR_SAMPLE_ID=MMETSP0811_2 /ASSEMBLY_ACC=CAM_ASM_000667 /LENGTH=138 /DNA_ID=CAMNT_0015493253 /DNA_START=292 /DNA_END=709 /DNA_ORIENTATION=+
MFEFELLGSGVFFLGNEKRTCTHELPHKRFGSRTAGHEPMGIPIPHTGTPVVHTKYGHTRKLPQKATVTMHWYVVGGRGTEWVREHIIMARAQKGFKLLFVFEDTAALCEMPKPQGQSVPNPLLPYLWEPKRPWFQEP